MKVRKYAFALAVVLGVLPTMVHAQGGTNSPYSQFGLGMLADQSSGFNKGMDGLGLAFHDHNQINYLNPASYSALDSLTFIFDAGMSGQITHFSEGGNSKNAKNASFEYIVGGFRVWRHLGLSFGLLPFTNIGYDYAFSQTLNDQDRTTSTNTYSGTGGLHQIYLGLGYSPLKGLSIGVNGSYLYGNYTRTVINSFSNTYVNTLTKQYTADVTNYKLDFGVQYSLNLNKKDALSVGVTYSPGHKIGGHPKLDVISTNSQTAVSDTTSLPGQGEARLKLELPTTFGVGFMYSHDNRLKVGVDYTMQKWGSVEEPEFQMDNNNMAYVYNKSQFKDRHKVTLGGEYCPEVMSRHFLKRIHYRAGFSYATPYYYIGDVEGPKEVSASVGVSIPIINTWNNRSTLNISAQWVNRSADNLIKENTFRINIGLTFNERWFAKWKVE